MLADIVGLFLALVCVVYLYKYLVDFILKVMSTRPDIGSKVPRRLMVKYLVTVCQLKANLEKSRKTIVIYNRELSNDDNRIIADTLVREIKAGMFGVCSYQYIGGWLWVSGDPEELGVKYAGEGKCVA